MMQNDCKRFLLDEDEKRIFSREVLEQAAMMVAQGKKIPLKKDVPFKLFLSNNTPASQACLRFMLSAMTGRTVTEATVTNPELLPDFVGAKKPRMDINCTFDGGQRADIELQLAPDGDDQAVRALYYACKLFSGALKEGELYKAAPFVYQIFLVDFDIFQDGEFFHHVMPSFRDGTVFSERLQIRFFNLKVPGTVPADLQKAADWCKFIAGTDRPEVLRELGKNSGWQEEFTMAMHAYNEVSEEERAWAYHLSLDRAETDYNNGLLLSEQRGFEQGKAVGRAEGLSEGREKGLAEGRADGAKSAKLTAARNLLQMKLGTVEQIAQAQGLPLSEVERLAAELAR